MSSPGDDLRRDLRVARRIALVGVLTAIATLAASLVALVLALPYFVSRESLDASERALAEAAARNEDLLEAQAASEKRIASAENEAARLERETTRLAEALHIIESNIASSSSRWYQDSVPNSATSELETKCPGSTTSCFEIGRRLTDEATLEENCRDGRPPGDDPRLCELDAELNKPPKTGLYSSVKSRRAGEILRRYLGERGACPESGPKYGPGCGLAAEQAFRLAREEAEEKRKLNYYISGWVYHLRACRLGVGHSCKEIAYAYSNGAPGIIQDKRRAEGFAIAACIDGDASGCNQARFIFESLREGLSVPDRWLADRARARACQLQPDAEFCRAR